MIHTIKLCVFGRRHTPENVSDLFRRMTWQDLTSVGRRHLRTELDSLDLGGSSAPTSSFSGWGKNGSPSASAVDYLLKKHYGLRVSGFEGIGIRVSRLEFLCYVGPHSRHHIADYHEMTEEPRSGRDG